MTSLSTPPWYRQFWPWFIMFPPAAAVAGGFLTLWLALQHADSVLPDRLSRVGLAVQPDHAVGASGASFTIHPQTGLLHLHVDGDVSTTPLTLRWLHPAGTGSDHRAAPHGAGRIRSPTTRGTGRGASAAPGKCSGLGSGRPLATPRTGNATLSPGLAGGMSRDRRMFPLRPAPAH